MNKKNIFAALLFGFAFAGAAHAAEGSYELRCDGDSFEAPMVISVRDGRAKVSASFDGPGSAIFQAEYSGLAAFELNDELTITQPVVAGRKPHFHVSLRTNARGKLVGKVFFVSTDSDQMPYSGPISCERN